MENKNKKFTINYKDHLGRANTATRYGKDSDDAETKFKTLYPDCTIVNVV